MQEPSNNIDRLLAEFPEQTLSEETADSLTRAIHEAGHAVVAALLKVPFKTVTIIAEGNMLGSFLIPDYHITTVEMVANHMKALLGGMIAHFCFMPSLGKEHIDLTTTLDQQEILKIFAKLTSKGLIGTVLGGITQERYLEILGIETAQSLKIPANRAALFAVADELMNHKTLSSERVKEICQSIENCEVSS